MEKKIIDMKTSLCKMGLNLKGGEERPMRALIQELKKVGKKPEVKRLDAPVAFGMP